MNNQVEKLFKNSKTDCFWGEKSETYTQGFPRWVDRHLPPRVFAWPTPWVWKPQNRQITPNFPPRFFEVFWKKNCNINPMSLKFGLPPEPPKKFGLPSDPLKKISLTLLRSGTLGIPAYNTLKVSTKWKWMLRHQDNFSS